MGAVPKFALDKERYDQNTFNGRFRKMLDVVDPTTLLCSREELDAALQLLNQVEQGTTSSLPPDEDLWRAKKIRDAMVHPDTKDLIPHPFRMSGFLPFNAPICVGALMAQSTPSILFWHWANQTHNALINYNNRNATQPLEMSTIAQGYAGAVTGAISVAMGLKTLIARSFPAEKAMKLQRFVALPAIMTAAAINVILMRRGELVTGIDVLDDSGHVVGTSQRAAKKALTEMTLSRMALPLPVFALPPIGSALIDSMTNLTRNRPRMSLAVNATLLFLGFGLGLPATIAIFPQIGTVHVDELEEKFQHLKDREGNAITALRYNKGL